MQVQPLLDRVLVKRDEKDKKTSGGIIIPDTVENPPLQGTVIAVGSGAILPSGKVRELKLSAGDRVMFSRYAGTSIEVDGDEFLMMGEKDIAAAIVGKGKKKKLVPLLDKVLVKRDPTQDKTTGGLFIPEQAQEPPLRGTVVAVGSGALLQDGDTRALDVSKDDRVLFNQYAGVEIEFEGENLMLLSEGEIQARINKE